MTSTSSRPLHIDLEVSRVRAERLVGRATARSGNVFKGLHGITLVHCLKSSTAPSVGFIRPIIIACHPNRNPCLIAREVSLRLFRRPHRTWYPELWTTRPVGGFERQCNNEPCQGWQRKPRESQRRTHCNLESSASSVPCGKRAPNYRIDTYHTQARANVS